jgi:hypothetical protein
LLTWLPHLGYGSNNPQQLRSNAMPATDDATLDKPAYGRTLTPRDEVRALLDRLPDTVTLEDIAYHLDVVIKVYEAEASLAEGKFTTHAEASKRFASWFTR